MGRKKTGTKKIEDNQSLMETFSKRRRSLVKKAYELGTLTGVDVALIVIRPCGKLITFSINSRIEDIFAKFINLPDDMRGIRIENQGHLLETLERIKLEDEAIVVSQQTASSSGSNSSNNTKIEELQVAISKSENKRDAMRRYLRNFSCDNDAPETSQSFEWRQDNILSALARVRERKLQLQAQQFHHMQTNSDMFYMQQVQTNSMHEQQYYGVNNLNTFEQVRQREEQLHLQQQWLFNVPMHQSLQFDSRYQNNYANMPVQQALPFDFQYQNDYKIMPELKQALQFDSQYQNDYGSMTMQQTLQFDTQYQNNYGNMPMLQAPFQTLRTQQQGETSSNNELFAVVEKYCRGSFSGPVVEQQIPVEKRNQQICFPTNSWSFPPYEFHRDHIPQHKLIQEYSTTAPPGPPQQKCTIESVVDDLIRTFQPNFKEKNTDFDEEDPCDVCLTFPEDDDIVII